MPRQKKETSTKSIRFITEISEAIEKYADDELISINAAVNKLLKAKLEELNYITGQKTE